MTRRNIGASAACLAAVVAAAVIALVLHSHGPSPRPSAAPRSAVSRQPGEAHQVAAALSRLAIDPAGLVAEETGPETRAMARQAVPAGSKVSVAQRSWAPDGVGGGTMAVTVTSPGHPPVSYAAIMVHERGGWKVLATVPLSAVDVPSTVASSSTP